jgi:hypothetical protein
MGITQEGLDFNIFSIKPTEFDEGQRDPFGFDDFSEKLGDKYLPFSGAVKKPIYFFFIAYVNWLLEKGKLNVKKKEEARLRLEKLLVYSWKKRYSKSELRGKNVLGNSKEKINHFKGNDGNWIIQTCSKIYGASVKKVIPQDDETFIKRYIKNTEDQIKILNEFLNKEGLLDKRNENFLESTLQKLAKRKCSLFSGNHQLTDRYKRIFRKYLETAILNTNEDYYDDIKIFFNQTNKLEERIYKRTIENEGKYPFKALNNWFSAFIIAVDKDINNENSKSDWREADDLFSKIPDKYKRDLKQRPEPRCWFERNGNKYVAKQGKDFDEYGWSALLRRAEDDNFYKFKHNALILLLQGIY